MNELLEMIDGLNLPENEQVHWEYVLSKLLDIHMPTSTLSKEDLRFLKEHGWYALFKRVYHEKNRDE